MILMDNVNDCIRCGSVAEIVICGNRVSTKKYLIQCTKCENTTAVYGKKDEAILVWNKNNK